MTATTGDKIPDAPVMIMGDEGPQKTTTGELLGTGKVVLIAVPGAFTPGCSKVHLPGYVANADEILAKGVDRIACIAVNDVFVMDAWAKDQGTGDKVLLIADGNGDFTKAMGLEMDGSGFGLSTRSQRYAAVIEDGVITSLEVEPGPGVSASACENVLTKL